jgi:hypothetical protein
MFIIIRVVVIATCAYAGSVFAGVQFPDLLTPIKSPGNSSHKKTDSPRPSAAAEVSYRICDNRRHFTQGF